MTITEVHITLRSDPRLRAFVTVCFDEAFVVHGIKVIAVEEGRLILAMPSRRRGNGSFQDLAHPITPDFRKTLEDRVFDEYTCLLRAGQYRPSRES